MNEKKKGYASAIPGVLVSSSLLVGRSRGFGFVTLSTSEEAQKAVEMYHEYDLMGRPLTVNIARPREDRPPRREGGGGGGGGGGYGNNW